MRRRSRSRKIKKAPDERDEKLARLRELAVRLGLEVRLERLTREVGHSVHGGLCRIDEADVVLLDKNADPGIRLEILCNVLAERDLDGVYIEPELRRLIGGPALDGAQPVEGAETTAAVEQDPA